MKKINFLGAIPFLLTIISLTPGCIKDNCSHSYTYQYYKPVYKTTQEVRANIKSNNPQPIKSPGKLFVLGNYIFLNELDKGIHIIDNSNPSNPINKSFIDIPGNMDLAVYGQTLYADLYTDLVALDISNPNDVTLKKIVENVFPHRIYNSTFAPDSTLVISDWEIRDTIMTESCDPPAIAFFDGIRVAPSAFSSASGKALSSPAGMGGSMARFALMNDRLYTVTYSDVNVFNISNPTVPLLVNSLSTGNWNIETIFPFQNKLFIGSQSGMFVYNASNPDKPVQEGTFGHVQSCDPVIADSKYAYVTLRSGSVCQGFTNELDILTLANITSPQLVKVYNMTNPYGLSKDGNLLFICDGEDGLKAFDATDVQHLQPLSQVSGITTYDVIAFNKIALVVTSDALMQFDYSDPYNLRLLSKIQFLD